MRDIDKDKPVEVKLNVTYEDYMRPALLWATEDAKSLAEALDVLKVFASGPYLMGLFGGERKSGMERYAGLVVTDLKPAEGGLYVRLFNTEREYFMSSALMRKHGIDIYKVHYLATISPFKCSTLNVVLSSISERELKAFLRELIRINEENMTEADKRRLEKLAEELRAYAKKTLESNSHYVIYRNEAIFTACVPEDLNKSISQQHTAYIECRSAEQAYYYAAALNYMAHKVMSEKRAFIRHFFTKPLVALVVAGLTWRDLPSQLRKEIAGLSYKLSKKLTWIKYSSQRRAIQEVAKTPEFTRIVELFDRHIKDEKKREALEKALDIVSGFSR